MFDAVPAKFCSPEMENKLWEHVLRVFLLCFPLFSYVVKCEMNDAEHALTSLIAAETYEQY